MPSFQSADAPTWYREFGFVPTPFRPTISELLGLRETSIVKQVYDNQHTVIELESINISRS